MNVCSEVYIQNQVGTAYWYQDFSTLKEVPRCKEQDKLGSGAFSEVVRVTCQEKQWALKKPLTSQGACFIYKEACLLALLNQEEKRENLEHFVQLVAFIVLEGNVPMALLTLHPDGDLFSRVKNSDSGLSLESTSKITEQMLKALSFLKSRDLLHRDIKPENIFMVGDDTIKIGDFGLAVKKSKMRRSEEIVGTIEYYSPELLETYRLNEPEKKQHDFPYDMWTVGYTTFFTYSRIPLVTIDGGINWMRQLESAQRDRIKNFDSTMEKIAIKKEIQTSDDLARFHKTLKGMLELDPIKRLTPECALSCLQGRESPVSVTNIVENL